jgi:hypothetical protein
LLALDLALFSFRLTPAGSSPGSDLFLWAFLRLDPDADFALPGAS